MRAAPVKTFSLCLILVACLWLNACGAGTNGSAQSQWTSVTDQATCEAVNPVSCSGLYGFKVDTSGNFMAGPSPTGVVVNGAITAAEL